MALMQVPVTKGKATVEIETDQIPEDVYRYVIFLGLKALVNRGMTKLEGSEEEKKAGAMEIAENNLNAIKAGKVRMVGLKTTKAGGGAIMTEARRLAKLVIKDEMKAAGIKVSYVEASEITRAANEYLETDEGKELIEQAKANIEARAAKVAKSKIDIKSMVKVSEKLVKKAEANKAKAKEYLSAKQAGKVQTRLRPEARS
jgi:hypothetical protein